MYTGIIVAIGTIAKITDKGQDTSLLVEVGKLELDDVKLGDSINVNGVCLTVVSIDANHLQFDVSAETLSCTNFSKLVVGSRVNLEKSLRPMDRMGGHFVMGHVDAVGEIVAIREEGRSTRYDIALPEQLTRYIAPKGSITVDGVSLTVNSIDNTVFNVNIIPHTAQETIFADYQVGSKVNLEVDMLARYLERMAG